jgi:uncharacterized protein (TIGR01777 family)
MTSSPHSTRIAVAGASGLVGEALVSLWTERGRDVVRLVRRSPRSAASEVYWNPDSGEIDGPALEGIDAVVHLGGAGIAAGRWSAKQKTAILESRVASTRLLSNSLSEMNRPPHTFICASAIGYYGDRGDEVLTEKSPPGAGFLADVCKAWEAATEPARQAGLRVVNLRIGMVLSRHGGALKRMLPPFKTGFGGIVGSGRQYMSWIALSDLVRAIDFLLTADDAAGPVNAVAPQPVTNREFTRTLGRALRRPTLLPLPGFAVRLLFGEMGEALLLAGNRVQPARLTQAGFSFEYPCLEAALNAELRQ